MTHDPAGLLERIPELEPLCEDAGVRKAVGSGDPFKVYRALVWARLFGRLSSHRETLKLLVRRRRLFARPTNKGLFLGTFNSFGAGLVGSSEEDPADGTVISLHAIVAIFVFPLFPLGAYLVRKEESSGLSSSYRIFARVPMSIGSWLYSRTVALGVLALLAWSGFAAVKSSNEGTVYLVNGFEVPVTVTLGNKSTQLAPRSHASVVLPVGQVKGEARSADGILVDAVELNVRPHRDFQAWNLAGAGVLYFDVVRYYRDAPPTNGPKEPQKVYCGKRLIDHADVDHVLTPPPEEVSMSKHQDVAMRSTVQFEQDVADHLGTCLSYLAQKKGQLAEALPAALAQARLTGWSEDARQLILRVASAAPPEAALAVASEAVAALPEEVDVHRWYQHAAKLAGRYEQVRKEYDQRAVENPDSAIAHYLALRMVAGEAASKRLAELRHRFPDSPELLRVSIYDRFRHTDWPATVTAYEALRAKDPVGASTSMDQYAGALVALRRVPQALAAIEAAFDDAEGGHRRLAAELYARVASHRAAEPDRLIQRLETEEGQGPNWMLRARAGLSLEGAPTEPFFEFLRALPTDPRAALMQVRLLSEFEVQLTPEWAWAPAFAEALRVGDKAVTKALLSAPRVTPDELPQLEAFVRGAEGATLDEIDLIAELRSAAHVVRARNESIGSAERKRLIERAKALDPLHSEAQVTFAAWSP